MEFSSDRSRQAYAKFMEEERKEQQTIVDKLEQPIKLAKLKREAALNAGKVVQERKKALLGRQEIAYTPKDMQNVTMTWEEAAEFTSREAQMFANETEDWYDSAENKQTLVSYFDNRDICIIDRRMWRAAFLSLLNDGLLERKPDEPVPVPVPVQAEINVETLPRVPLGQRYMAPGMWFDKAEGQMGVDPETLEKRFYSAPAIRAMDAETYRRCMRVPTPLLVKSNFE